MTGPLFAQFIQHLGEHVSHRPLILFFDGHSTHSSLEAIAEAKKHNIEIMVLPPNTTHLTQPLDLSMFGPFKKVLNGLISKRMFANVITEAKNLDIEIMVLIPNSTHLTQPLDLAMFGPFKKVLNGLINRENVSAA